MVEGDPRLRTFRPSSEAAHAAPDRLTPRCHHPRLRHLHETTTSCRGWLLWDRTGFKNSTTRRRVDEIHGPDRQLPPPATLRRPPVLVPKRPRRREKKQIRRFEN